VSHDLTVAGVIERQVVRLPEVDEVVLVGGNRCEACAVGSLYEMTEPDAVASVMEQVDNPNVVPVRCTDCDSVFAVVEPDVARAIKVVHVLEAVPGMRVLSILSEQVETPFTLRSWLRFEADPETVRIVKREAWDKGDYDNAYVDVDAGTYLIVEVPSPAITPAASTVAQDDAAPQAGTFLRYTAVVDHLTHGAAVIYGFSDDEVVLRCLDCQEDMAVMDVPKG